MMGLASGGFGLIVMVLFWVLVVGGAVWLISRLFPQAPSQTSSRSSEDPESHPDSPLEILKQRYARGDISKSEYLEMRNTLRN